MDDDLEMEFNGDGDVAAVDIDLGKDDVGAGDEPASYFASIDNMTPVPNGDRMDFDLTISVTCGKGGEVETRNIIRRISLNAQSLFDKAAPDEGVEAIVVESKAQEEKAKKNRLNEMRQLAGLEPIRG